MSVKKYRRAFFLIIMLILTIVFYFIFCGCKSNLKYLAGVINGAGNFLAGEYVPSYTFYDSVESPVGIYIKEFNFK